MKLTIEENSEAIKRYRHIKKPAPRGATPCSARCPGSVRTCTVSRGHAGPHAAHGWFGRVLAVWERGADEHRSMERAKRSAVAFSREKARNGGLTGIVRVTLNQLPRRLPSMEEALFLVLGFSFVGFAIYWMLLIFGAP